jgi:hypothetical protein
MRALKATFLMAGLMALTQYLPVYYNSSEFGEFVRREAGHTQSESQLKQSLLERARVYSLPVKASDISISRANAVLRVSVDYRVPVNLIVYNPELTFHVKGSGLLPEAH